MRVGWCGSLPVDYSSYSCASALRLGACTSPVLPGLPRPHQDRQLGAGTSGPGLTRALPASGLTISGKKPAPGRANTPPPRAQSVSSKPTAAGAHCPSYGLSVSIIFKTPYYIYWGRRAGKSEGLIFEARLAALGARIRPEPQSQTLSPPRGARVARGLGR